MAAVVTTPTPAAPAPELAALLDERPGAVFLRADLQVHTPLDPAFDPGSEPKTQKERADLARCYLSAAQDRGIELIGITEHNDISWIDELRRAATDLGMHLLPGFEVESAEGVHVLCLFDPATTVAQLEETLVGLGLTQAKRGQSRLELRTNQHFADLLKFVQDDAGGICIAAHIESNKGLLAALRQGARVDAWKTEALLAAQTCKPPSQITSGNGRIIRGEDPKYARQRLPAYLLTSDCRSLDTIGTTSTWIKMDTIGVSGLRQAFLDPESRIAYDDPTERREGARILAVSWEGDFLDGVRFPLNMELNCLIGGRGTGKSTVIESIRYAFDLDYRTEDVGRAASDLREHAFRSGSKISVIIETDSPARARYIVERTAPHAPVVRDFDGSPRPELDPKSLISPCIYGQKEIYGIAQNASARLDMLDGFAVDHLREILTREADLLSRCRENADVIIKTRQRIDDAESKLAELPSLEEWRSRFREAGFEDLLRERRLLDREQRLLDSADKALIERDRRIADIGSASQSLASALDGHRQETLPNAELLSQAESILSETDLLWDSTVRELREELAKARRRLAELRATWEQQRSASQAEFDRALRELQAKMPEVDPERYLDVERRIEQLVPLREVLKQLHERLASGRRERATLLVELNDVRGEKHRARQRATDRLNEALAGSLVVKLTHQGARDEFLSRLTALKSGARTDALRRMVSDPTFTPAAFAEHVRSGSLSDPWNVPVGQASALERALDEDKLLELEVAELPDQVELLLDVSVGEPGNDYRPLDRLSPGQKSTAILLLVMQESKAPLLIDQPEDDLDNRFIYDDIVVRLKQAKPARQFLIATHNANIPVLGDAEQIVALDAREVVGGGRVSSFVRARGSIDSADVRAAAEQILEGGREAFLLRQAKYQA
jgi:PHP family Zn ribbon phosphoesterase